MSSFYRTDELDSLGLKQIGKDVLISRKVSIYGADKISIGNAVRIDDFCILSGNIVIGDHVHIAAYVALYGSEDGIVINDFCNLSSRVTAYATSDDYSGLSMTNPTIPDNYKQLQRGKVLIEKHSIIGSSSIILPGVTIGEGSSFGCFSLINHDSESWSINVGIPFHKIRERDRKPLVLEKEFLKEKEALKEYF